MAGIVAAMFVLNVWLALVTILIIPLMFSFTEFVARYTRISVGIIATFITYGQNFIQPLRQLANMYNSVQAALAGSERVFEIIDSDPEVWDAPEALPLKDIRGDVRFDHVSFGHRSDR